MAKSTDKPEMVHTRYIFVVHNDRIVTGIWMSNGLVKSLTYPPDSLSVADSPDSLWVILEDVMEVPGRDQPSHLWAYRNHRRMGAA